MKIERKIYLNRLIDSRDNGLIKIITGIRRSGKSYLLFRLFAHGPLLGKYVEEYLEPLKAEEVRAKIPRKFKMW